MRTGIRLALIVSALALVGSSLTLSKSFARAASAPQLVKDIVPGNDGSIPWWITSANGSVYFSADDPEHGRELWRSDGTSAGTILVKDIRPGSHGSRPELFTEVDGVVYFRAENRFGGELWRTDGTNSGTSLVKDAVLGSSGFVEELTHVGETLFFTEWGKRRFLELWRSDGTTAGTILVKGCPMDTWCGAGIWELTALGESLFFVAQSDTHPGAPALWRSDGTRAGTVSIASFNSSHSDACDGFWGQPQDLTVVGDSLFFSACDKAHGQELWRSDGTETGTYLVKDIAPGTALSHLYDFTDVGGTLMFDASDPANGDELWRSDGTEAGTHLVKDIAPGADASFPSNLVNVGGTLMFIADDGMHGDELWKSDGTEAGTLLVKDILVGKSTPFPNVVPFYDFLFTTVGDSLYFLALDPGSGKELWMSDGSDAGTAIVQDLFPGPKGSAPRELTTLGGTLFFTAMVRPTGRELWKVDTS